MKTLTKFKSKWRFMVPIIFLLPLLGGCQDQGLPDEEGAEVPLSRVPDNPGYASLPLIGTQWKLIGFVDGKKNRIRLAKPGGGDSYKLIFEDTGEIKGHTSTNTAQGKYSLDIDSKVLIISQFIYLTRLNEFFDGRYYIESMNNVYSFDLSSKGLKLYYNTDKYLLFNPIE